MSDLFHNPLWLIPASVFIAGLIGSPHCMMMCGPIVLNFAGKRERLIAYQIGRMISYVSVGAIAGALGQGVLSQTRAPWISSLSLVLIGTLLIFNGYRALLGRPLHFQIPKSVSRISTVIWKWIRISTLPKTMTAGLAGLFTVFLPCGHLYSYLLGAVATGSALSGAVFMWAFWLGSTPLLSFSGAWLQKLLRPQSESGRRWAGILLIGAGLISVAVFGLRANSSQIDHHTPANEHVEQPASPHCH